MTVRLSDLQVHKDHGIYLLGHSEKKVVFSLVFLWLFFSHYVGEA